MYEVFFKKVNEKVNLTSEEEDICKSFLVPKKVRKKQYILQEGDVCKYSAFVEKGALRSYTVDERGHEHIVQFAIEGWWISDMYSFITGEPSVYNIDVLEDAELLLLSNPSQEELLQKVPKFERYQRLLVQGAYIALQRRLVLSLSQSAEEKYTKLTNTYPDIIQRVPQHMIASYLGITPETLSRIRRQISDRK
ncbi:MAG: Crp/Fnr family transcriptional regulator [Ginsengibacter sp.]